MAIPSFFKQNKPRGFNYMPRYYDPAREEREERLRTIGKEQAARGVGQGAGSREQEVRGTEQGAGSREQGAQGRWQGAQSKEQEAQSKEQGAQSMEHGAGSMEQGALSSRDEAEGTGQPYRSKIVRGDMKNYFPRNKERVERHTLIRLLVIIMIMVLGIYIYVRFF